jgi:HK97 gp10 family phage protein
MVEDFLMANEFDMTMEIKVDLNPAWRKVGGQLKDLLQIAARNIEKDSKQRMHDWPAIDTSDTVNSIAARRADETSLGVRPIVGAVSTTGGLAWRIGPTTDYAPFIEFGTERMRARPFMVPASEQEKPRLLKAVNQIFQGL